ncbi:unnamed protein product [Calicophoron daubneyi]|uniref:Uncharacterized protein n=1 Tax=Calicophoron daubneyi TaxID=300641 RepID=A0AAV2TH10_CALDB
MTALMGEWKCVESKNMDAVLVEIGHHQELLDCMNPKDSIITIDIDENEVYLKEQINGRSTENTFTLGKEVEEFTPDGRIVKATVTLESDRQIQHIQQHGFNETIINREVIDGALITTIKTRDATGMLKYVRIGMPKEILPRMKPVPANTEATEQVPA